MIGSVQAESFNKSHFVK